MGNTPDSPVPLPVEASVQSMMQAMDSARVEMVSGDVVSVAEAIQQGKLELRTSNVGPLVPNDLTMDDIARNTAQRTSSGCTLLSGPSVASDISMTVIDEFGGRSEYKCIGEDRRCIRFWGCESDYCAIQCDGVTQLHATPIHGVECRVSGLVLIPSQTGPQCSEANDLCSVCR